MKGSYLLCPQKHALKSSPSVNTSSPNRDFFHNTFFQSRRNCLHPCWLLPSLACLYIYFCLKSMLWFFSSASIQTGEQYTNKNGCQSYLLIRLSRKLILTLYYAKQYTSGHLQMLHIRAALLLCSIDFPQPII